MSFKRGALHERGVSGCAGRLTEAGGVGASSGKERQSSGEGVGGDGGEGVGVMGTWKEQRARCGFILRSVRHARKLTLKNAFLLDDRSCK